MGSIPTRSRHIALALLAGALLSTPRAGAQQVRALVVHADSSPGTAVILVATDSAGAVVGRAVTDARGGAELRLLRAGLVEVRALRIGFRPTRVPSLHVAAGSVVDVRIVLSEEPARLDAILVRRDDPCGSRDDARARVADVWDEARKALMLSQGSAERTAPHAEWRQFERRLDSLGRRVLEAAERRGAGPSDRPFVSRPAGLLAQLGYVIEDAGGFTYFAPDADVLLSEAFARTHCFQLADSVVAGERRIGLRFRPLRGRDGRREVAGTLWLDRQSAELRHLEFRYTGMPAEADLAEAGGRVEFVRLSDGHFLVRRWWIRMPDLVRISVDRGVGSRLPSRTEELRLRGIRVAGGEVASVSRNGQELFRESATVADEVALGPGAGREAERPVVPAEEVSAAAQASAGRADSAALLIDEVRRRTAERQRTRYAGFDARRGARAAMTLTREEIDRRPPAAAWQLLRAVRAVRLLEGPQGVFPASAVGEAGGRGAARATPCYLRLAIDGVLLPDEPVDLAVRLPRTVDIHGIEVFVGDASLPPELAGDTMALRCGVIVVWTR